MVQAIWRQKLPGQMARVFANSRFYQRKFARAGLKPTDLRTLEDLARLPFTVKQELRQSLAEGRGEGLPLGLHGGVDRSEVLQVQMSSGTTGSPAYVGATPRDVHVWAEMGVRVFFANGFRPGDWCLHVYSMARGFVGGLVNVQSLLAQAMSGLIAVTGHENAPPVKVGTNICDFTCALLSCLAVMTGLFHRERTGEGIKADLSLLEGAMAAQAPMYAWYFGTGRTPPRMGTATPFTCPSESFDTADRPIVIAIPTNKFWKRLCHLTGLEELLEHPTMASNAGRVSIRPQIASRLQAAFAKRTADEWLALLIEAGIPAAPIYDYDEALADPQVKARAVTWQYDHPVAGQTRVIGNLLRFVGHPYPDPRPAPAVGEHTGEVLAEVGVQAGKASGQPKR